LLNPPEANITITSDLGIVGPITVDEFGRFIAEIEFQNIGKGVITVTDLKTGLNDSVYVNFPLIYLPTPKKVIVNDTFTFPISVFIPYNQTPLGYYDFVITFNNNSLELKSVVDGDLYDNFPSPYVEILNESAVRILQGTLEDTVLTTGNTDVANLTFKVLSEGATNITLTFYKNSINSFLDINGSPIVTEPLTVSRMINGTSNVITIRLKIWRVEDQATKDKINRDLERLKRILRQTKDKCGTEIKIEVKFNNISKEDWRNKIDKDGDGYLDEYTTSYKNPTEEEKALLSNFYEKGHINVYYIKEFDQGGNSGSGTTGEYVEWPRTETRKGVVVDSDDSGTNTLGTNYFTILDSNIIAT